MKSMRSQVQSPVPHRELGMDTLACSPSAGEKRQEAPQGSLAKQLSPISVPQVPKRDFVTKSGGGVSNKENKAEAECVRVTFKVNTREAEAGDLLFEGSLYNSLYNGSRSARAT